LARDATLYEQAENEVLDAEHGVGAGAGDATLHDGASRESAPLLHDAVAPPE